jgi:hypothetical protein
MSKPFNIHIYHEIKVNADSSTNSVQFTTSNKTSVKEIEKEILMKLNLKKREMVNISLVNVGTKQSKDYRKWIG